MEPGAQFSRYYATRMNGLTTYMAHTGTDETGHHQGVYVQTRHPNGQDIADVEWDQERGHMPHDALFSAHPDRTSGLDTDMIHKVTSSSKDDARSHMRVLTGLASVDSWRRNGKAPSADWDLSENGSRIARSAARAGLATPHPSNASMNVTDRSQTDGPDADWTHRRMRDTFADHRTREVSPREIALASTHVRATVKATAAARRGAGAARTSQFEQGRLF